MQMVKTQIPDREECARSFAALIRRGRVDCYQGNTFIIPEPGLRLLGEILLPLQYNDGGSVPDADLNQTHTTRHLYHLIRDRGDLKEAGAANIRLQLRTGHQTQQQRTSHGRRRQRHQNHHGVDAIRQNTQVLAEVDDD